MANPDDRVALRCWCGFGSPSLRTGIWSQLRRHCELQEISPKEALQDLLKGRRFLRGRGVRDLIMRYQELEDQLQELHDLKGQDLVDALFPEGEEWAESLRALALDIEEGDFNAKVLLDRLRSSIVKPELPTEVNYVRVMSLHKAKGLTADLVVILGCIEGLIPRIDKEQEEASLEEQRRLFYVAITRTRMTLILSSIIELPWRLARKMKVIPQRTYRRNEQIFVRTIASRFLSELGPACPSAMGGEDFLDKTVGGL